MSKYIIRNCSTINNNWCRDKQKHCKDITDCVMKRIVESCNFYEFNYPVNQAIQMLTQNIKNMLEIEEVDE